MPIWIKCVIIAAVIAVAIFFGWFTGRSEPMDVDDEL